MSKYQDDLIARLKALPLTDPPAPWRLVASIAVGGFEALGFSIDSKYLLIVSSSGRGLFDSTSGKLLARDSSISTGDWYDLETLTADAIGPIADQLITVAGIHGGGLPFVTLDGWVADLLSPEWPSGFVTLSPPGSNPWVSTRSRDVAKIAPIGGEDAVKCYGFSWSRQHLVVATSYSVDLFLR